MRVAVDATALGGGQGGDETMLRGLLAGLAVAAAPRDRFVVLARPGEPLPAELAGRPEFVVQRMARRPSAAHFLVGLPRALRAAGRLDLLCVVNHGPVPARVPLALVVQDLSFVHHPEWYPPAVRHRLGVLVPRQARAARTVMTVSEHSRADLLATYGLDPARVAVVPNAVVPPVPLPPARRAAARQRLLARGVGPAYVCYLGNLHPRKNVPRLVRAFLRARRGGRLAGVQLVLAGATWWGDEERAACAAAPPGSVVQLGRVDGDERELLLGEARALAYVSLFEGFGLPPLEAMARGTPALVSDRSCLPEVTADAALQVDPTDESAIAQALIRLVTDQPLRERLVHAGLARAAVFSVTATGLAARAAFARALAPLGAPAVPR